MAFFDQSACNFELRMGSAMSSKLKKILGGIVAIAIISIIVGPTLLHKAGMHPEYTGVKAVVAPGTRALIIATNHAVLSAPGETDGPATGVFSSEMTHPYYNFIDAGVAVDLASINGGNIPVDPLSLTRFLRTPEDDRYLADEVFQGKAKNSLKVADVDFTQYDIIFFAGGWGAAYDLGYSPVLGRKVSEAYYADKKAVIGGVCHGVLGLIQAKDHEGNLLIAGRRMTGVTNKQIKLLGIEVTPLHPESELRKAGVIYESTSGLIDMLSTHVTIDDERRFVTGQNQNSGHDASQAMMHIISEREVAAKSVSAEL